MYKVGDVLRYKKNPPNYLYWAPALWKEIIDTRRVCYAVTKCGDVLGKSADGRRGTFNLNTLLPPKRLNIKPPHIPETIVLNGVFI